MPDSSLYWSKHYWVSFVCMKTKVHSHDHFYNSLCHRVDFPASQDLMWPPLYQNSPNRPHLDFYSSPLMTPSHHVCNAATSNKNLKPMKISSWNYQRGSISLVGSCSFWSILGWHPNVREFRDTLKSGPNLNTKPWQIGVKPVDEFFHILCKWNLEQGQVKKVPLR
jgi:hypothetical protein